ncbi:MAG TPA: hypothetical protein VFE82_17100 [Ramlibacter sp.]|uniref:hypothetical protein n=1 Tax=Ramlibacter sp. TaxID=1917967 RepID=UPI002D32ECE2|nr:hypothetical protein [Ramlibacter sp.]HZY20191.1 hypothetical protein [Ramlibacter sp.]
MTTARRPGPSGARFVLALMLAAGALGGCDQGPPLEPAPSAEEVQERLGGTWLREVSEQGITARRVLALQPDGSFREWVRVVDGNGQATNSAHEGTWLYDGSNLKRKYTLVDGRPPSRLNLPFATFEITFESRNEFVGVDHIHGNRIRYRRVPPETRP